MNARMTPPTRELPTITTTMALAILRQMSSWRSITRLTVPSISRVWTVDDDDITNENTFTFPEETSIPGNGFLVIFGGGVPTGFEAQTFTGLPRLGNNGDQVRLSDGQSIVDSIGFEDGAAGAMVSLPIRADGWCNRTRDRWFATL